MGRLVTLLLFVAGCIGAGWLVAHGPSRKEDRPLGTDAAVTAKSAALPEAEIVAEASGPVPACAEVGAEPEAPSVAITLNGAGAKRLLGALTAKEYSFKEAAAERIAKAAPDADARRVAAFVDYLWLLSLNEERLKCVYALVDAGFEAADAEAEALLDPVAYKELLASFANRLRQEGDSDNGQASDADERWIRAWERKVHERQFSPYLEPFLEKGPGGRAVLSGDKFDLAVLLWPYRDDTGVVSGALAYLEAASQDGRDALGHIRQALTEQPEQPGAALANLARRHVFSKELASVKDMSLFLPLTAYGPELAERFNAGTASPLAMSAGASAAYAPQEGGLPNGLSVRRFARGDVFAAVAKLGGGAPYIPCTKANRPYGNQEGAAAPGILAAEPVGGVLGTALCPLSPLDGSHDEATARTIDRFVKYHSRPVYMTAGSGQDLAGHLGKLCLVYANSHEMGERLAAGTSAPPAAREGADGVPTQADPGVALRFADPTRTLYYLTLLEQASAEQADRILGPATGVLVFLPGEGWIAVERAEPSAAARWNATHTVPSSGPEGAFFSLPDAFLGLLVARESTALVHSYAYSIAAALHRQQGHSGPPEPETTAKTLLRVQELAALLDEGGLLLRDRYVFYNGLYDSLSESEERAREYVERVRGALREQGLAGRDLLNALP